MHFSNLLDFALLVTVAEGTQLVLWKTVSWQKIGPVIAKENIRRLSFEEQQIKSLGNDYERHGGIDWTVYREVELRDMCSLVLKLNSTFVSKSNFTTCALPC